MSNATSEAWPEEKLFSIEFPGHIENMEKVKAALGGDRAIANVWGVDAIRSYQEPGPHKWKKMAYLGGAPLDLRYRYLDPFSTPIQGQTVLTNNLLLKATRRYKVKRKPGASKKSTLVCRAPAEDDEPLEGEENDENTSQVYYEFLGAISKTVRFAGLADYQHIVDPADEIYQVKSDVMNMNYDKLISIKVDNRNPDEDYDSLQIIPPVYISKLNVALPYKYRKRDPDEQKDKAPASESST